MKKLISLNAFTDQMKSYLSQKKITRSEALSVILMYNDFLNMQIREDMFIGNNPLFPDFVKCSQSDAVYNKIPKSFSNFGEGLFQVTVLKKYAITDKNMSFCTSFSLKTINDLVDKVPFFSEEALRLLKIYTHVKVD